MKRLITATSLVSLGLLIGCENMNMPWDKDAKETSADAKESAAVASAQIRPAQAASTQPSWGKPTGIVKFTQRGDKVHVKGEINGLSPGKHGFHIHDKGDLSAPDLSSAGPHFNPEGHKHGGPKDMSRHAGDLGNITADDSGKATIDLTVSGISIGGKNDIVGKSLIVHANADDLKSDPSGNAGGRAGGGVIERSK